MPPPGSPEWWVGGRGGTLSPWTLAEVWALVKISDKKSLDLSDEDIAADVEKVGGGQPARNTIRLWRETWEADSRWYPGKPNEDAKTNGRKKIITAQQQATLAKSAMALKEAGVEPTAAAVKARCPAAALNSETGEFLTDEVILDVFKTRCYDNNPDVPWNHFLLSPKTR
jgi:hypothetical protein